MPTPILDRLPYLPRPRLPSNRLVPAAQIAVAGQLVPIKPYQVIVWVSLAYQAHRSIPPSAARFPTILDTGTTHDFVIKEEHLRDWAQIDPKRYRAINKLAVDVAPNTTSYLEVFPYNVWLFRNQPFERDQFTPHPFCLHVGGIAVYPKGGLAITTPAGTRQFDGPRLPLLGLRAFRLASLELLIDTSKNLVSLTAP